MSPETDLQVTTYSACLAMVFSTTNQGYLFQHVEDVVEAIRRGENPIVEEGQVGRVPSREIALYIPFLASDLSSVCSLFARFTAYMYYMDVLP